MGIRLAKCLIHNISTTMRGRAMVSKDRLQKTACQEYNGHVTDDVKWPQKVKVVTSKILRSISQQPCEIHSRFILTTNRKPHTVNPMVTWPMSHVTLARSMSWPKYLWSLISQKPCELDGPFKLTTYIETPYCESNGHVTYDVTMTSKGHGHDPISQHWCEIGSQFCVQSSHIKT